ncbi:MAG TPA: hypothetical protein VGN72_17020 [Tepidisphaeraceae bacterium]|jgi:hypothetical protein|nr:hypothetical protein [Tepidisphaeraceae bacterium]
MNLHPLKVAYAKASRRRQYAQLRWGGYRRGRVLAGRCGFFGNMFMTLNGIRLCEAASVQPEPYWDGESLFYDDAHGDNAWAYYFQTVPSLTSATAPRTPSADKTLPFKPTADTIFPLYPNMGIRATYAEVIRRFVRLRPDVQADIDALIHRLFGDRVTVGVHVRQTDTVAGFEARKTFGLDAYCRAIDEYLRRSPDAGIFAATDSVAAIDALRDRYGSQLVALDCIRSTDNVSIHGHYDGGVPGSPYQKGLEVVRDAYLLSRVDHLVRVNSRVTAYSLCLNPSLTFTEIGGDDGKMDALPWLQTNAAPAEPS